jgi:DNA-directed RNA polymerase subunit N (RpoN/RPB10)
MNTNYFLKGYIKFREFSFGPCAVDFDFDKEIPGYIQKKGKLYLIMNKKIKTTLSILSKIISSKYGFTFTSENYHSSIEMHGISLTMFRGDLRQLKSGELIKFAEFTFRDFIEKSGDIKNLFPIEVVFHIENFVFFRPSIKVKKNYFQKKGEPQYFCVSTDQYDNCLFFETKEKCFETVCEMSGNLLLMRKLKYEILVDTKPLLVIKSRNRRLTGNEMIVAGENLILIVSLLEERYIKYISKTIYYKSTKEDKLISEFMHTNYFNPMDKPWRIDLIEKIPMDKFNSDDIRTMYLKFKKINNCLIKESLPDLNIQSILFLYLSGIQGKMVYNCINDFYSCIEKLLKLGPKVMEDFKYSCTRTGKKHKNKLKDICKYMNIDYFDLLDEKGNFAYIQMRDDYIHNLSYKHEIEQLIDAYGKVRYLCRRIIFTFLGLDYLKYNSCDPTKLGQIGL